MILGSCCVLGLYIVLVPNEPLSREEEWLLGTEVQLFYSRCGNAENPKIQKSWFLIDKQLIIFLLQMKRQFKNKNDLNLLQYPKLALYE